MFLSTNESSPHLSIHFGVIWFIDTVKAHLSTIFGAEISIDEPYLIFMDRDHKVLECNAYMDTHLLLRLDYTCYIYLIPCIICPWGCTEHNHQCGYPPFEFFFQRHLLKRLLIMIISKDKFKFTISARN